MLTKALSAPEWLVVEEGFDLADANAVETRFTVGNGYLGTRASLEEGHDGALPGTFLAGVYDGHDSPVVDLVVAPDWVDTAVYVEGRRLDVETCTVLEHRRVLDLRQGLVRRSTTFEDADGRRTVLETLRFASMAQRHLCGLRVDVTPVNHSGVVEVVTGLDARRRNLERLPVYPDGTTFDPAVRWDKWARSRHLVGTASSEVDTATVALTSRTVASGIDLAYVATTTPGRDAAQSRVTRARDWIASRSPRQVAAGASVQLDKLVAVATSRDADAYGDPLARAVVIAREAAAAGFDAALAESTAVWEVLWEACDATVVGDERATQAVRFGIYHLLISANPDDPTVSIGAKSLSGEGYRGHVFWDTEIMMLPFFVLTQPRAAKALLRYRHHTLDGARENSKLNGTAGARFAWESADTGREECPQFTPDGVNRFWTRDEEIHVSADVAYGVVTYAEATGDREFLHGEGAELLVETSRFWATRAECDPDGTWHLRQVMGPDEFHSHVDDNAFTNHLAQWQLRQAANVCEAIGTDGDPTGRGVLARLAVTADELATWRLVAARLANTEDHGDEVIEQFAGYFERTDVPIVEWDANGMPLYPPGFHHFNCEPTTLLKQPDSVMLQYLLPDKFSLAGKRANFEFYEGRTLHKSSLSPSIHAILGIEVGDPARAVQYFERSAYVDLADNQGNTAEGMHIASAAGTWQILASGFGGMRVRGGELAFDPWLPPEWAGVTFRAVWRGQPLCVSVDHDGITLRHRGTTAMSVLVRGDRVALRPGSTRTVRLRHDR